ncbi:MAG: hypothetical protein ACRYG8_44120 [Janthinobacterium lividum]
MTIHPDYMLKKPSGPSASKQFLDQRVVPLAVNAVGALEVGLYRVSDRTGIRPALLMTGLTAGFSFLLMSRWRGRSRRFSH